MIIELWLCSTFMVHVLVLRIYTLKNLEVKCGNVYNLLLTGLDKMCVYVDREREREERENKYGKILTTGEYRYRVYVRPIVLIVFQLFCRV